MKTSRELWEGMNEQGWAVEYHRYKLHSSSFTLKYLPETCLSIPISPDRPIEDNYLDAYLRVIKATDPDRSALVFSCGLGAVRTTFGMVAAIIVRRKQRLLDQKHSAGPSREPLDRILSSSSKDSNAVSSRHESRLRF